MAQGHEDETAFAERLFRQECRFIAGAARLDGIPPAGLPEIAFAGRSNVGKSSLLNALTGRRSLARTSNTPGRTQQLNFFELGDRLMLVDLPGYGFARAPKKRVADWTRLVHDYLKGRASLRRVCVLVDARHGLKDADRSLLNELDTDAVPYQIVLTKRDKVKAEAFADIMDRLRTELAARVACHPDVIVTSAAKGMGIGELRISLAALAESG